MADVARRPDAKRSRALLIGVGKFADEQLPVLSSVRNNLTGLAEVLTSPWGAELPDTHCTVLSDPADMGTVGDHLMQIADQAQDLLLVYYAGHGLIDPRGELHLALPTTRQDRVHWTAMPFSHLRRDIANSAASNRVLILDCCFSGRAIEAMADSRSVVSGQIEITGTYTLTATSANTLAHAPRGARYTAFTGALLDLLRVGIPEGPELLTLDIIYSQLLRNLAANGSPRPERQGTLTAGFLALGRNRAAVATGLEDDPSQHRTPVPRLPLTTNVKPASEPEYLNLDGAARRIGLSLRQLRRIRRRGDFPEPAGIEASEPYWREETVLCWAAASSPDLAGRVPLKFWPNAIAPAGYLGAETHEQFVIQRWQTQSGLIAVVWSFPGVGPLSLMEIAPQIQASPTIVAQMRGDFGIDGPGVTAINTARPADSYIVPWRDIARVLGRPVPYWPFLLRIRELICAWEPGADPVTAPVRPDLDTGALLRLAAMFDSEHPTHHTLLNLARVAQARNTTFALLDLDILHKKINRGLDPEVTTAVAAIPMLVPDADREDLDPTVRRDGWLEVLSRADTLSVKCVHEALAWDGGKDFPFSNPGKVDSTQGPGAEWVQRLEPIERTAAFELIDYGGRGQTLTDPATDAPAVLRTDGTLMAAIPQRLRTTSCLAELILSRDLVWIRTADGMLYPAPKQPTLGLSWGYPGGGPAELAALIHRLLDDITAAAPEHYGAPDGLEELTQMPWPNGTVLTREQLEAARAGHPPHPPTR